MSNHQKVSFDVIVEKYAKGAEKNLEGIAEIKDAIFQRVSKALASVESGPDKKAWQKKFYAAYSQGLIPAGRVASAAGTDINATLINCFVQPVGDAIQGESDGKPGIYDALREAAETMRRGGGVGYAFGDIRPKGAYVKGTASNASGPVSYMRVFNESCKTVESAGSRRGAQMGVMRVNHPDIEEFVLAKQTEGELRNFNISVGVTQEFMEALIEKRPFELVHKAMPSGELIEAGAYQRKEDGLWVYKTIDPQELWDQIMTCTYNAAEPGVVFLSNMNIENNLWYAEIIEACNPCAEQPLPSYGCCCLSSVDLSRFVSKPFTAEAEFDYEAFAKVVRAAIRSLDNVLELTYWPLEKQRVEAMNKRRVGLGYTALGDALIMLGLRYDREEGREVASKISRVLRDNAYWASVEIAKEKGAFPLFDAEKYLDSGFAKRLPEDLREAIKIHGIRNSHLISIAPTGTISLAFADNGSNGLEPAFSWYYNRVKRMADGENLVYRVEDHAFREYRKSLGIAEDDDKAVEELVKNLPSAFVSALEISAQDHVRMMAAIQPYVDSALSKTVNVPADYAFADFKNLYLQAWEAGLKGLATYRPNMVTGSVLSTVESQSQDLDMTDPDRRIRLDKTPEPALASLRWPSRPETPAGNPAITYTVNHPTNPFAVFVGHLENGSKQPFEVWCNGAEAPRGIGALAKTLSTDMRSFDRKWLEMKLEALSRTSGDGFSMAFPPEGVATSVPSSTAALAKLLQYRCNQLGAFDDIEQAQSPMVDALFSLKEPKSGTDGTMSWTVDVKNPATGDDFVLFMKELAMPDGRNRPYSVWIAGKYPEAFDGLCKSISIDMRIVDPAWVAKKLRSLAKFKEAQEDFLAREPGSEKQQNQPSTIAYVAKLIIHRYNQLGILDENGYPSEDMGLMNAEAPTGAATAGGVRVMPGKECPECKNHTYIRKDGCDFCTSCGHVGSCG